MTDSFLSPHRGRRTSGRRRVAGLGLVLLTGLGQPAPASALEVPRQVGPVTDGADLVDFETELGIVKALDDFRLRRGPEVAVLTLPSLAGEDLADFSLRVARGWRLGRAGADDGLLFLIARDDRLMRIEVGVGLEQALTDDEARSILDDVVAPRFRDGDFSAGVAAGVDAILGEIEAAAEDAAVEELPAEAPLDADAGADAAAADGVDPGPAARRRELRRGIGVVAAGVVGLLVIGAVLRLALNARRAATPSRE